MEIEDVALILSGIALTVSILSLWVNNLAAFSLRVTHDAPTLSLYKITPDVSGSEDGKTWWIPSFDVGFSFLNAGRRPGQVLDIRIVADFEGHRSKKRYVFYPKWIVDYAAFQRKRTARFEWIHDAVLRDWYALTLGGQQDAHTHLILEGGRWDDRFQGRMICSLQVVSSEKRGWAELAEYEWLITEDMFDEKSTHTASDKNVEALRKFG